MQASRRHRHAFAALLGPFLLPLVAAGCAAPPDTSLLPVRPREVVIGLCGLAMTNSRDNTPITRPYEMNLMFRPSGDEARITFVGTGWGPTWIGMSGPGKDIGSLMEAESMSHPMDYIMPRVGTWHFRFADNHCLREFDVVVKPRL
jgi:hypothetical protein